MEERFVVEAFWKVCFPVKVLVSARSVDEAAVTVMLVEPSNEVPLIVRGVWSVVAVLALPEMEPEMVLVNACVPPKVLLVYVFGMVVEALMYEFTPVAKSETCEFVMERLLSVVIEFTDEVAARLPMNEVVARAVVKYRFVPSSMSFVVVEYQSVSARYDASEANVGRPRVEVDICIQVFPAPPIKRDEDAMVPSPVPPLVTPRIPVTSVARFTSPVEREPAVARTMPLKFPTESEPKKPFVDEAYADERLVVDAFPNVCNAVKVFAVYVFGMVVEALMYELTPLEKSETCEFVMERLLSVVIEFTDEVAARLPMNEVVARAVVK